MKVVKQILAIAAVTLLAACTSGPGPDASARQPRSAGSSGTGQAGTATTTPTTTAVLCNGTAGKTLLTGLLADLGAGRKPPVATYFSPPVNFVRWWDPTSGKVIGFGPGPTDNSVTLDELQEHLDKLASRPFEVSLVGFTDSGYQGTNSDAGGWFLFDLRGRVGSDAPRDGGGKGAVDCASGRLKVLVVDDW